MCVCAQICLNVHNHMHTKDIAIKLIAKLYELFYIILAGRQIYEFHFSDKVKFMQLYQTKFYIVNEIIFKFSSRAFELHCNSPGKWSK